MPPSRHELEVMLLERRLLEVIGECEIPDDRPHWSVAADALARCVAGLINEGARDYHGALDQFRGYLEAALMREG